MVEFIRKQERDEETQQETERCRINFLAILAHDLGNPRAPINAATSLRLLGPQDETRMLGLKPVLVKSIVDWHERTIRAESAGTRLENRFTVCLPRIAPLEATLLDGYPRSQKSNAAQLQLLVVDDNTGAANPFALLVTALEGGKSQTYGKRGQFGRGANSTTGPRTRSVMPAWSNRQRCSRVHLSSGKTRRYKTSIELACVSPSSQGGTGRVDRLFHLVAQARRTSQDTTV